jgi:hypothetical protein
LKGLLQSALGDYPSRSDEAEKHWMHDTARLCTSRVRYGLPVTELGAYNGRRSKADRVRGKEDEERLVMTLRKLGLLLGVVFVIAVVVSSAASAASSTTTAQPQGGNSAASANAL